MIIEEIHYEFHLMADKVFGNDRRAFSVSEVDWLLGKSQRQLMSQLMLEFELNKKRTHDLSTIHVKFPVQPLSTVISLGSIASSNGLIYLYELPLSGLAFSYFAWTKLAATVTKNNCDYRSIGHFMDNDDFESAINTEFELNENNFIFNIGQATAATPQPSDRQSIFIYSKYQFKNNQAYIEYIRMPQNPTLGNYAYFDNSIVPKRECELPQLMHSRLVDTAIELAYTAMNDQAVQLKQRQSIQE
jgi:hypothetical protein